MKIKHKQKTKNLKQIFTIAILVILLTSLSNQSTVVRSTSVERDYWPTDGWQTKTFEEVDMNDSRIDVMFDYIDYHSYDIESILIVKDGYLVLEEYLQEDTAETRQIVWSVTKSFMSTLIGIAIEEGYIESVDQKMFDFLYNASIPNIELKKDITIYHLLTMTSGIAWNEMYHLYGSPLSNLTQMMASDNWVEFVLSCEMDSEPGTEWNYNTGVSHLLSAILQEATGNSSLEYATKHIFDPLGISNVSWFQDPQGIYYGGSLLELLPRDMAKFGYLFLNNGTWDGTQIVSQEWIQNATSAITDFDTGFSYGYQWWIRPSANNYQAQGLYMQIIIIVPKHDMVVVITADEHSKSWYDYNILLESFIALAAEAGYTPPISKTSFSLFVISSIMVLSIINKRRRRK
jgi:CubicO group peptidase (beta-lactamase class C family)